MNENIPDPWVRRLSAYLSQLEVLATRGVERVSSETLDGCMNFGGATVRRDLALFGQLGRRGVGYETTERIAAVTRRPQNKHSPVVYTLFCPGISPCPA